VIAIVDAEIDLHVAADVAFDRLVAVETWPVWLSCVRRIAIEPEQHRRVVAPGDDLVVWGELARNDREIYEVETLEAPYRLSFVGAYSCRKHLHFLLDPHGAQRTHLKLIFEYPIHGGVIAESLDRLTVRPKLTTAFEHSLLTLRGLVEHDAVELTTH